MDRLFEQTLVGKKYALFEKFVLALGILVYPLAELLVLNESIVRRQHHEGLHTQTWPLLASIQLRVVWIHFSLSILVLFRSSPLAPLPLLVYQQSEEVIGEGSRRESPRSFKTGATRKGNEVNIKRN